MTPIEFDNAIAKAASGGFNDVILRSERPLMGKRNGRIEVIGESVVEPNEALGLISEMHQNSIASVLGQGKDSKFRHTVLLDDDSKLYGRCHVTAIHSMSDDFGVELIIRIINDEIPSIADIDLPLELVERIRTGVGMMLVGGETGSGKSTTIAAGLVHHVCHNPSNVLTFENPIEFNLSNIDGRMGDVVQSETPRHLSSFDRAFQGSLRRAPDILFWSEVRNGDEISNLARSTLTGHFTISTVHTNSTEATLSRLIDSLPPNIQRSVSVNLFDAIDTVVNQRLELNPQGTGRTAIRSWCYFDEKLKDQLKDSINSPEKYARIISSAMANTGRTLLVDAKEKFSAGRLDISSFKKYVSRYGNTSDLTGARKVGEMLLDQQKIDESCFIEKWKSA